MTENLGRPKRPLFLALQIGRRIVLRRTELDLTRAELSLVLGITHQQLAMWEGGKKEPTATTLKRLGKALRCKAGWLAFGDEK